MSEEGPSNGNGNGDNPECTEIVLETVPFDPRFPNQNQTKHCYVSFLDYHRCVKLRGEDYPPCEYFLRAYRALCPNSWIEKWNDQLENGTFPAKI